MEALKAQAVASRSYAVANLDRIANTPPTQLAQVYHPDDPAHGNEWDKRWYKAIQETKGIVLINGGQVASAYFSASAGGITQQSGQVWMTNLPFLKIAEDCNGNWPNNCYEAKVSPWFHKPWGDRTGKTENSTGNNCQNCNPWLTKAEMVDLFNLALLHQQNGNSFSNVGVDVSPVGSGGSSHEAIRQKANSPITDFSVINFYQDKSAGQTASIQVLTTNRGVVNIPGASLFAAVNVRAPGSIYLNSKLFDVVYP
jgi:peptidoglycan hydrolase-like amidase